MKNIVNFLFEIGILNRTPRRGFHFLGTGKQSLAEHLLRTTYIGYTLAQLEKNVNTDKIIKMCLFHDLAEGRTSDLNYVHQQYAKTNEHQAVEDITKELPFGEDMKEIIKEYEERKTKEALLAKDADNIEWILSLKEQQDTGNKKAEDWIKPSIKRLKTEVAKHLAEEILETNSDEWWFKEKDGDWWINRNKKTE